MNGINLAATKEDLLDRSIIINLEEINDEDRRTPEELWREFNVLKPQLLGYIFDILIKVLKNEEDNAEAVRKLQLSRMAEFAKYGEIASRCMGNEDNEFLRIYKENKNLQVDEIIEFSPVATLLMCMMFQKYDELNEWNGTPTGLYTEIKNIADTEKWELNIDTNSKQFPKSVSILSRRLNEVKPILKSKGLLITDYRENDEQRTKKIKVRKEPSVSSVSSRSEISCSNLDNSPDGTCDNDKMSSHMPSRNNDQNRAQTSSQDGKDGKDGIFHSSIDDVSSFIKLKGIQQGNKLIYNIEPTVGDLSIQNNFIGGHLRMRGEGGGRYPTNYLEFIEKIFGPEYNTIEVCSNKIAGHNKGGNCFTVDINPEHKPDLVVDGQTLEGIRENSFSRWLCDPPYNENPAKNMYGTELPNVSKLLGAGARVVKPGSLLFLLHSNHTLSNIVGLRRIGFLTISVVPNNETRILNIYVKLPDKEITK